MTTIAILVLLTGQLPEWQTYTQLNLFNDICGDDSVLFLASAGGIVMLDAREVQVEATVVNTDGLPVNGCLAVGLDPAGNLWVGTDGGGLAVIPAESTRAMRYRGPALGPTLPDRIPVLAWDGDRLLVGSDRGLFVIETRGTLLDTADDQVRHFSAVNVGELLSDRVMAIGVADCYWVGTNRGVTSVDREFSNWIGYRQPMGDSVKGIGFWRDSLLIATERGLAILAESLFRPVYRFDTARAVFDLVVSGPDIYVATSHGVYRGEGTDSLRFQLILQDDTRSVHVGEYIWVGLGGTEYGGWGLRYSRTGLSWEAFWANCIASGLVAWCAFNPVNGKLYLCHYLGSWSASEIDVDARTVATRGNTVSYSLEVYCDSKGKVWFSRFSHDGGLSVYDPGADTWGAVRWGESSSWNVIQAFGIDRHDTKWIFNQGGVILALDSAGEQVEFDLPGLVSPPGGGYEFAFDSEDRVWLGLTAGLVHLDYNQTLKDRSDDQHQILASGLPSTEIRSIAVDHEDRVWVATPSGAAVWDGERFQTFNTDNSDLLSNSVTRVRVDGSGQPWFLTNRGVSVYDQVSGRWTNYTPQSSELLPDPQGFAGFYISLALDKERGIAAVGTQRGLSVFRYGVAVEERENVELQIYPNPCILGEHEQVVVANLPADARVEIRSLAGKLVAKLEADQGKRRAVWKVGDVSSGLYLAVVYTPQGTQVERVAVIRR